MKFNLPTILRFKVTWKIRLAGIVAALLLLPIIAPLGWFALRNIGKSFHWRFVRGMHRITDFGGMQQYPAVDAAGKTLTYEAVRERFIEIFVHDLATGRHRRISDPGGNCRRPVISGNGEVVLYETIVRRNPRKRSYFVLHNLITETRFPLADDFDFVRSASMDHDARYVFFCAVKKGLRKVYIFDKLRGRTEALIRQKSEEFYPVISANGEIGAFLSNNKHHDKNIFIPYIIKFSSGTVYAIDESKNCKSLSISADGNFIAYETSGDGPSEIKVYDLKKKRSRRSGYGFSPALSPDGSVVFFESITDAFDLIMVHVEKNVNKLLLKGNPYPSRMTVSADGKHLYLACGLYNSLSRTGDTDIFRLTIGRTGGDFFDPLKGSPWRKVQIDKRVSDVSPRRPPKKYPKNSIWVAAFYFQNDGTRRPMREQQHEGIRAYSERLASMIDDVKAKTGSGKVNVVAHCMGGLVAKGAIQYYHDNTYGFTGTDRIPASDEIERLICIATPHRGHSFVGWMHVLKALGIKWYRFGFQKQSYDMIRDSEFMKRLNLGAEWQSGRYGTEASSYKPGGQSAPPKYISFTGDAYLFMDGGILHDTASCQGLSGSRTHFPDDTFAIMYETAEGKFSTRGGRRLCHVPEDIMFNFVAEDKSRALSDYLHTHLEKDVPVILVHGSFLFRAIAELTWIVQLRRLAGEVHGWPRKYVYIQDATGGEPDGWLIDANYENP